MTPVAPGEIIGVRLRFEIARGIRVITLGLQKGNPFIRKSLFQGRVFQSLINVKFRIPVNLERLD